MSRNVKSALVKRNLYAEHKKSSRTIPVSSRTMRRAWDSNPQVLSDNGFQGREGKSQSVTYSLRTAWIVLGVRAHLLDNHDAS